MRPMKEKGPADKVAEHGFAIRQLQRRPAPVASGMWGIPDLILSGGATTAADNTEMPVPFPDYSTPHTAAGSAPVVISSADGSLFSLNVSDDGDAGNDRFKVTTMVEGFWAAELITQWDQTSTGGTEEFGWVMQTLTWESVTGFGFSPTTFRDSSDWMDADVHPNFEFGPNSYLRTWMPPHYVPANKVWKFVGKQVTGVSRGLSGISAKLWLIRADDLSTWTFDSV